MAVSKTKKPASKKEAKVSNTEKKEDVVEVKELSSAEEIPTLEQEAPKVLEESKEAEPKAEDISIEVKPEPEPKPEQQLIAVQTKVKSTDNKIALGSKVIMPTGKLGIVSGYAPKGKLKVSKLNYPKKTFIYSENELTLS